MARDSDEQMTLGELSDVVMVELLLVESNVQSSLAESPSKQHNNDSIVCHKNQLKMQGKKKKEKEERKTTFMLMSPSDKQIKLQDCLDFQPYFNFSKEPDYKANLEKGLNELFMANGKMYDLLESYKKYISSQSKQVVQRFLVILKSIEEISQKVGLLKYSKISNRAIKKLSQKDFQYVQKLLIHMFHQANTIQEKGYQFLLKPVSPKNYFSFEVMDVKGIQDMKEVYPEEARLNLTAKAP